MVAWQNTVSTKRPVTWCNVTFYAISGAVGKISICQTIYLRFNLIFEFNQTKRVKYKNSKRLGSLMETLEVLKI